MISETRSHRYGVTASISGFHPLGRGSIPRIDVAGFRPAGKRSSVVEQGPAELKVAGSNPVVSSPS